MRAEGKKVKDNPELLTKSLKRKEQKKRKHQKDWSERKNKLEKKAKDKQEKRNKNLKARKQTRIDNKIKKAKKKGRAIPGF